MLIHICIFIYGYHLWISSSFIYIFCSLEPGKSSDFYNPSNPFAVGLDLFLLALDFLSAPLSAF